MVKLAFNSYNSAKICPGLCSRFDCRLQKHVDMKDVIRIKVMKFEYCLIRINTCPLFSRDRIRDQLIKSLLYHKRLKYYRRETKHSSGNAVIIALVFGQRLTSLTERGCAALLESGISDSSTFCCQRVSDLINECERKENHSRPMARTNHSA